MRIGFIGLGLMGEPMATHVLAAGFELLVWNRSTAAADRLRAAGAEVADEPLEVLSACDATIIMLSTEDVACEVLQPQSPDFRTAIRGHGLIHMATTSAEFSAALHSLVAAAGGWYVEAPVSGSRAPAEAGRLVAMAAGDDDRLDEMQPVLASMCTNIVRCGRPPAGTRMKFAVNVFLIGLVTSLAESYHFAQAQQLDLGTFATAINSGQMASPIAGVKLDKLLRGDLSPQAGIPDVFKNNELIADAARGARLATPVLDACHELYRDALDGGFAGLDMIGVIRALELRTDWSRFR